jgi:plastocyanin
VLSRSARTVAAAAIVAAVAACAGPSHVDHAQSADVAKTIAATQGPDGIQEVTIKTTNDFRFDPPTVTAHTGKVKVTLVDVGSYPHNLAVAAMHFTSDTVTGGPGQNMTTFTMTFAKPGTYPFECTFHSSAGMRGTFLIH